VFQTPGAILSLCINQQHLLISFTPCRYNLPISEKESGVHYFLDNVIRVAQIADDKAIIPSNTPRSRIKMASRPTFVRSAAHCSDDKAAVRSEDSSGGLKEQAPILPDDAVQTMTVQNQVERSFRVPAEI
jgi:hypothetical protein